MIFDNVENLGLYKDIPVLKQAIEYILSHDVTAFAIGKNVIDGENLFCSMQKYQTKDAKDCKAETHKKYIDLQYFISGEERIQYGDLANEGAPVEVREDEDLYFYENHTESELILNGGHFAIFFPQDVHVPCMQVGDGPSEICKAVFKIRVR